jgi:hypothetical protein
VCKSGESVALADNDLLAIQVLSTLNTGSWAFTFSIKFE